MSRPKSSEPKVKLQNWVSAAQAAAIKEYLQGGALLTGSDPAGFAGTLQALHGATPGEEERAGHAGNGSGFMVGQKKSTATPSGSSQGAGADCAEQLALQSKRADDLQIQVDELQHALDRKEVELEQLMQTGGTERQSAYITRLQAKIVALGGDKKEFDQT